jgi:hypothetical protein
MADLEDESGRYKVQAQRLSSEVAHLQNQIQNELFLKSTCEIEKLGLEDNLTNLKQLRTMSSFNSSVFFLFFVEFYR